MLALADQITQSVYFACLLWVLSFSLLPILAAWTGRTVNLFHQLGATSPKAPALLFLGMIYVWGIAYSHMSNVFIATLSKEKGEMIARMEVYQYLRHPIWKVGIIFTFLMTFFYPPFVFVYTASEMIFAALKTFKIKIKRK